MQVEDIRLSFQDFRVKFRMYTPDDDHVLHRVLFVGSPVDDVMSWDALASMLAEKGYLCVVADLPGFGWNPCGKSVAQDNNTRAQTLWGILDDVESNRGDAPSAWHLVGHGSGCAAVMTMGLLQPDFTRSRVLICPVMDRFMPLPLHHLAASRWGTKLVRLWHRNAISKLSSYKRFMKRLYKSPVSDERIRQLHHECIRKGMPGMFSRALKEGYRLADEAYAVTSPLMVFWGAKDSLLGSDIPKRILKKLPEDVEKHVVSVGHMPMESDPSMVRSYIYGWVDYIESGKKAFPRPTTHTHNDKEN